jgi:hypothetical protein
MPHIAKHYWWLIGIFIDIFNWVKHLWCIAIGKEVSDIEFNVLTLEEILSYVISHVVIVCN